MLKRIVRFAAVHMILLLMVCQNACALSPETIEDLAKSVLMLEVYDSENKLIATGSGFVAYDNRTIITNYHVAEGADYLVGYSDDEFAYMITGVQAYSKEKDIAILSFFSPTNIQPLTLDIGNKPLRGESVIAIGSPVGIKNTVSLGNVSACYEDKETSWIQFTAPISSGSSGGALFNEDGKVIGITSASLRDTQNINLAIHVDEIQALWNNRLKASLTISQVFNTIEADNSTIEPITPTPKPSPSPTPSLQDSLMSRFGKAITIPYYAYASRNLSLNDTGTDIKQLQKYLRELGVSSILATGIMDDKTMDVITSVFPLARITGIITKDIQIEIRDGAIYIRAGLNFPSKANAKWEYKSGNILSICFQVKNTGDSDVTAFELYVYATDVWGNKLYGDNVYYATTTKKIRPDATAYSDYLSISKADEIYKVYCGIHKVKTADGKIVTINDKEIVYSEWSIKE